MPPFPSPGDREALLRELADAIPQIVWTAAPDGGLTYVNARGAEYAGRPSGELHGQTWVEAIHPDDLPAAFAAKDEAVRTGAPREFEFRLRRADGVYRWHVSRQVPKFAADGTISAWFGTCTDIDDLKQIQHALRDTEARLAESQRIARLGSWRWDAATGEVWWSDAMFELFGVDRRAGQPTLEQFLARLHPDSRALIRGRIEGPDSDHTDFAADLQIVRGDGTSAWIHSRGRVTRAADGTVRSVDGTDQDITDRRRAEARFREQELLIREAAELAQVGGWGFDPVTLESDWTPDVARMYGLDPSAPPPMLNALEFFAPEHRPALEAALAAAMQHGVPHDLELQLNAADGITRWVRTICRPIVEDGRVVRVRGSLQDITDRKHTESALQASEQRYRRLVDLLPTAVMVQDGARVLYCNPAFIRLVGAASLDDVKARPLFEWVYPDDQALARARLAELLATGELLPAVEVRLRHVSGRPVPTYGTSTPITGYGPQAFLIAFSDLTERERATQLLRTVLGSVTDAILTIDARGIVQSANEAASRQFGQPVDALIGTNVSALMPEPHRARHDAYIAHYLATGDARVIGIGREVEGQRHDGTRFPAELTVTEFTLDGERHFTGVLRDISARKLLEDQFRQAQKMEAVGRLAGGVAHDFNNLLTVINVYCEVLLASPMADDDQRESVAAIRDAGERATRLTQQLLAFGRKAILEPKVLELNDLVAESARLLRRLLGEDIILIVRESPRPVRVKADPTQLEQVIMNLAVNARDAMPTGGRLTIETAIGTVTDSDLTPVARLTVADTGHGMTDEVRRSIFEPFFTTKGVGKGTGLGLSVVDGAIAQCGGGIAVESTVGVGTSFRLWLPLAADAGAATDAVMSMASRGAETVLIVEDDDAVRGVVRMALEMQGFTVLEASGGAEAMRQAEAYDGDLHLLVSDVVMPEMSGRQVLEAIRRLRPGVRALFMSGYTDDAVLRHGVVESTDAFIQKPFTPLSLARKVRQVLDGTGA